jgi:hypothetical protein
VLADHHAARARHAGQPQPERAIVHAAVEEVEAPAQPVGLQLRIQARELARAQPLRSTETLPAGQQAVERDAGAEQQR